MLRNSTFAAVVMSVLTIFGLCPLRHHQPVWSPEPFEPDVAPLVVPAAIAIGAGGDVTVQLTGVSAIGEVGQVGLTRSVF